MAKSHIFEVEGALSLMYKARDLLLEQLRQGRVERSLAESFEQLDHAITFVEHPEELVRLCPCCGSLCYDELDDGRLACLSCDECWNVH